MVIFAELYSLWNLQPPCLMHRLTYMSFGAR